MGLLAGWLSDPQASATLLVGIAAGVFGIYQLRAYPAERTLRINARMKAEYGKSGPARGDLLSSPYSLMLAAYNEVREAVEQELARAAESSVLRAEEVTAQHQERQRFLSDLQEEARRWSEPSSGLSYLAAHEILQSEFKLRALLHCIEVIRNGEDAFVENNRSAAVQAVNGLNDIAVDYSNGVYPAPTLLGLVHRSLAQSTKALLPYIWEKSLDGRWGRRVLHLGIAAEHYNDVTPMHWASSIQWRASDCSRQDITILVHQRMMDNIFGKYLPCADSFAVPRTLPRFRLRVRALYWRAIGTFRLTPRVWPLTFGGWRLRQHRKAENDLAAILRLALSKGSREDLAALSFGWTITDLWLEVAKAHKEEKRSRKEQRGERRDRRKAERRARRRRAKENRRARRGL